MFSQLDDSFVHRSSSSAKLAFLSMSSSWRMPIPKEMRYADTDSWLLYRFLHSVERSADLRKCRPRPTWTSSTTFRERRLRHSNRWMILLLLFLLSLLDLLSISFFLFHKPIFLHLILCFVCIFIHICFFEWTIILNSSFKTHIYFTIKLIIWVRITHWLWLTHSFYSILYF